MPFPSPGDLPNPDIKPRSPALQADFLPSEPPGKRKSAQIVAAVITRYYKSDFKSNIEYLVRGVYMLSHVWLFATPWPVACQAPLPMGFPRQEYWSALPFPPPGDLPDSGIEPASPVSPALTGEFFNTGPPGKTHGIQWPFSKKPWISSLLPKIFSGIYCPPLPENSFCLFVFKCWINK